MYSFCFSVLRQDWPVHIPVRLEHTTGQNGWIETTLQEVVTGKLYVIFIQARSAQSQLELSVKLQLVNHTEVQVQKELWLCSERKTIACHNIVNSLHAEINKNIIGNYSPYIILVCITLWWLIFNTYRRDCDLWASCRSCLPEPWSKWWILPRLPSSVLLSCWHHWRHHWH